MRRSSLDSVSVAINREIDSKYDVIKDVSEHLTAIESVATEDLAALTDALNVAKDFTGITVVSGSPASWDAENKILTVPTVKGDTGDTGAQGLQGIKGDTGEKGIQGERGVQGSEGPQGETGEDGAQGIRGVQGVSVHHLKGTNTTESNGDFDTPGYIDTYTLYGDAAETINLGSFNIRNGSTAGMYADKYDNNRDGVVNDSDRVGGKTLDTLETERNAAIAAAQLALGTNYSVTDHTAKDALIGLVIGDKVFVADDGDTKWAHYLVIDVTDGLGSTSTYEVIMDEDTYLNANTAASIKIAYESNADTNAFIDAEKAKLANTETSDELDIRDIASKDRTNHTGTQLANTISDLDATIGGHIDVIANTADRHVHSNKAVLDGTTASYTVAEETKLSTAISAISSDTLTNKVIDDYTNFVHADATHFKIISSETLVAGDVLQYVSYDIATGTTRVIKRNAIMNIAIGIMKEGLASETIGLAASTGKLKNLNTSIFDVGDMLYPDASGGLVNVKPEGIAQPIAYVLESDVDDGVLLVNVSQADELPVQSGNANKFLKTNGTTTVWETPSSTAGRGVSYFLGNTVVTGNNYNLSTTPEGGVEQTILTTTNSTIQPTFMERYVSEPIGGTTIDGGIWTFNTYASVDSDVGTSEIVARVNKAVLQTATITSTGTGLTRTFTASEAVFVAGDANSSILEATLIQTPTECFWIDTYISATEVTATSIDVDYVNETDVTLCLFYKLFQVSTGEVNGADAVLYETQTIQPSFDINSTDKILVAYFATTTTSGDKVLTLYKNGTEHYSNLISPLVYRHDDLPGLNDGEYRHLGSDQYDKLTSGSQSADTLHEHSASGITNVPSGNLEATTVQGALNELQSEIDLNTTDRHNHTNKTILDNSTASYTTAEETKVGHISVTQAVDLDSVEISAAKSEAVNGTATNVRYDKILGSLDIVEMVYDGNDNLVTVRYTGDNDSSVYYRDVLTYDTDGLDLVKHFHNTSDLVTESASTDLAYTAGALTSTTYTEG